MRIRRQGVALLLLCLLTASRAGAAEVRDMRLWRAPDHTRLVLDLSAPVKHSMLLLDNPRRVVIDLENIRLRTDPSDLTLENTPVSGVRTGIRNGGDLRIVLDMRSAATPKVFALRATDQALDRLVIDLFDPPGTTSATAPSVKKSARSDERRDIVVAIDAGHGGEDPGALGPGRLREKHVVLAISEELQKLFQREPGFSPTLIRSGDYYVSLRGRRDLARKREADLFVSVHADAFRDKRARGASVYALSTSGATSTTARYLAQKENAADLIGGVSLSDKDDTLAMTLADLSMTSTLDGSLNMGSSVLTEMGRVARLHKKQVEQAGFAVLKSPDIPSILVETGFISNPDEARRLGDPVYRRQLAAAIHKGIVRWFRQHPPAGTLLAWQREQGSREYTIVRGDTLSEIARRFSVSMDTLREVNGLRGNRILVGNTLRIPAS